VTASGRSVLNRGVLPYSRHTVAMALNGTHD
jgi:hypothetical protein